MRRSYRAAPPLVAVALAVAAPAAATDGGALLVGGGWFDVGRRTDIAQLDLLWRGEPMVWSLQIEAGAMVHTEGAAYGFCGVRRDVRFGRSWGASLGFGVGLFTPGDGPDLGGTVEFRTALELFAKPTPRSRLAVALSHLSNAGIYDENPGANSVVLLFGRRLGRPAAQRDEP